MLLILLLLLLSLQNSSVSIIWPWRLFGMCYQACKLSEASSGKLSVTRKWDVDKRWWDLCCFRACFDSMPGLFHFWTLQERLRCNLPMAACGQRLYIARGPSTRGPNYWGGKKVFLHGNPDVQMTVQIFSPVYSGLLIRIFVLFMSFLTGGLIVKRCGIFATFQPSYKYQ